MSRSILRILLFVVVYLHLASASIKVRNGRLVDDRGGELIFHGLNLVSKSPPYHTKFNETDMQLFQELGINGIRLGVMWPGVEPKKGEFDQDYLDLMRETVQVAGLYRIFTLVEFHQDLFSQKFCADGVPIWAVPPEISKGFPRPLSLKTIPFDQKGYPYGPGCGKLSWSDFYFSNSVGKAFGALWTNRHGLRDSFIKYWMKVAETFKDSQQVIAYELINQPWPGDHFKNPLVMVPGLSQAIHMQNAYDLIAEKIREVDPDHNICFEPVTWLNNFRSGFSHPPGGNQHRNSSILCYHYYKPPTLNLKKFMKARMADINRLKIGGLLSQFYVIGSQGQQNVQMMNACDNNLQSWFGWLYNIKQNKPVPKQLQSQDSIQDLLYDSEGEVRSELIEGITRTYAPRVAGVTLSQKYDPDTKKFVLVYNICTTCGNTSIFVSTKHIYKKGYTVGCFPSDGVHWQKDGDYYLKITAGHIQANTKITVTITSK